MNIGMFSDTYYPERNGQATAISLYKKYLEELGHNVYLFIPKYDKKQKRDDNHIYESPSLRYFLDKNLRLAIPISPNLIKIKKLNLDVIHSHDPFSMGIYAKLASKILKIPHVGTHHTMFEHYTHYVPKLIRPSLEKTQEMIKKWCLSVNKVIAPTDNIKEVLESYGVPSTHIKVIPTGIDVESFQNEISFNVREHYNISNDEKFFLFVGRVSKEKNIDFLIKVYDEIQKKYSNFKFLIVGDGKDRENLKSLVKKLNLEDKIIFTGALDREKVIDIYKQAYMFIFASFTETQGLVVLESMAAGTPVVALGKMGVYDLLSIPDNGGIMIEELKKDKFVEEIEKLIINNENYEYLKKKGVNFVEKNFSTKLKVIEMANLYEEVIKEYKLKNNYSI
jgi:glycosyltransferase involved in cell wall biosynthesis